MKSKLTKKLHITALIALTLALASPSNCQKPDPDSPVPVPSGHGYVGIDDPDPSKALDKIFYWYFPSRNNPETSPLVIWLTGGPGCSSMMALSFENGAFSVNLTTGIPEKRTWAWNRNAHTLFVDQPIGTGFSVCGSGNYIKGEFGVQKDFYLFFTRWLDLPQYQQFKGRPLYLTGESYSGHYVPYIGHYFYNQGNPDVNLQGIAFGNGWTYPQQQYPAYLNFSILPENAKYTKVSKKEVAYLRKITPLCGQLGYFNHQLFTFGWENVCGILENVINKPSDPTKYAQKFNRYDIRQTCKKEFPLCYDQTKLDEFYNSEKVQKFLGVNKKWASCDDKVGQVFERYHDLKKDAAKEIVELVDAGLKVLVYSGVFDFSCNWLGTEIWLSKLNWVGEKELNNAKWEKHPLGYGEFKKYKTLEFLKIYNAGHMVPTDQPKASVQMLNELTGQPIPQ